MNAPIETFQNRMNDAMLRKGITQAELCRRTGLPKSSISQYLSGKASPRNDKLFLIAQALNVDEAWLLGYDVPEQRRNTNQNEHSKDTASRLKAYEDVLLHNNDVGMSLVNGTEKLVSSNEFELNSMLFESFSSIMALPYKDKEMLLYLIERLKDGIN